MCPHAKHVILSATRHQWRCPHAAAITVEANSICDSVTVCSKSVTNVAYEDWHAEHRANECLDFARHLLLPLLAVTVLEAAVVVVIRVEENV
jgi:hypothetical protein